MFGFSRKTRGELMRAELGESWDHLLTAASHAANGVGKSMGPRAHQMRGVAMRGWDSTAHAFAPLAVAYRQGAADATAAALKLKNKAKAGKKGRNVSNKRMGMLIGLLAAGAAVGAAGALVMRRRRRHQWSEYDPNEALDSMSADARSMMDKTAGKGGSTMDKMSHQASKAMNKAGDKLHSAASSMRKTDYKSDYKSKADESAEAINDATDNIKSKLS
ncbi:hypothetical protein [Allorhizocola rhizosphaerae]|uniref:hypothetical protein n=1 Tax=Allorhizocola rhizosphaerae TaxID=1872709 RepID=UPI000E3B9EC5|nr:hypothetical protein [Allorhizocola rhizosphaerae]